MPPNETSPLLPKNFSQCVSPHPIDTNNASDQSREQWSPEQADGDDIERQPSNDDAPKHAGMPEVRKRLKYIFPAICIGIFLVAVDQTLVVSTYGTIGTELDALNSTSWIATAYFLTFTAFQPLYGKLSDIFGRKSCLLFAYILFGIGSTFCGLARNIGELIAARAIAGIGGSGMTTVVTILMSDVVSLRDRGTWQGYLNIIYATGQSAGAPLGGLLADSIGWRWAFVAQGPFCLVAIAAVSLTLHLPKSDHSHWVQKIMKIDFLGSSLLILAVAGLLIGLDHGSNESWNSPITIAGLCTSLLFIIFILVERYVASHPVVPFRLVLNHSLFPCYLCNFFSMGGWLAALFFVPLYLQVIADMHAAQAGLLLVPCIVGGVSGSLFAGKYMQRTGKYYWLTVVAFTYVVLGVAIVLLFSGLIKENIAAVVVGTAITAFCNATGVTATLIGLIAVADHNDQAVVTACLYLFRSLGTVLGISMSSTAFNQTLRKGLGAALNGDKDAEEIAERVRASLDYFRNLEPGLKEAVKECYSKSITAALSVSLGLVVGSAVFAWFVREKRLGN